MVRLGITLGGVGVVTVGATAVGCGMMAGLFFVFSNVIMRALSRVDAGGGLAAMQGINRLIVNGPFLSLFLGSAVGSLLAVGLGVARCWQGGLASGGCWLIGGGIAYLVGVIGVTFACSLPLNEALDRLVATDPAADPAWRAYLVLWSRWNHMRWISATPAATCFTVAVARWFR